VGQLAPEWWVSIAGIVNKKYLISQIRPERYEYVLNILSITDVPENCSVFIYGTGKQSKSTYSLLKNNVNVEVLWFDFILKGGLKILKYFIAGYAGLLKIKNIKVIKEVFEIVSGLAMVSRVEPTGIEPLI
jgi:hypothetical protein